MIESQIDTVLYEQNDKGIATITLNIPDKLNCMTAANVVELTRLFRACDQDPTVRVIILKGAGKSFCSGGDLNMTQGAADPNADARDSFRIFPTLTKTIQSCDKPVIAQVHGYAMGAGMSLALACDLVYAAESATFSSNFNHLGVPPEMGVLKFLPETVGVYQAKEIWYTAKRMSGTEGERLGFVSRVCPDDELEANVMETAMTIAALPAPAIRITKRLTNDFTFPDLDAVLDAEMINTPFCSTTPESKKLFASFFERKKK